MLELISGRVSGELWAFSADLGRPPGNCPLSARIVQEPRWPAAPSVSHILRRNALSRVRLNDRAISLKQPASGTPSSLSSCASETALDCASSRSSLRAVTASEVVTPRSATRWRAPAKRSERGSGAPKHYLQLQDPRQEAGQMTLRARLADTINAAVSYARLQTYLGVLRILQMRMSQRTRACFERLRDRLADLLRRDHEQRRRRRDR
jgi:hypothetical protein